MTTTTAPVQPWSRSEREQRINEIKHRADRWRLMDASEETLQRMSQAIDARMADLEEELREADNRFEQVTRVGDLAGTAETQEKISELHEAWAELQKHDKAVKNALQEQYLRNRLIALLGSERRLLIDGDLGQIDLEPQSRISSDRRGVVTLYPLVAGGRLLGLLHMVLPDDLSNVFLYTRAPMTLAHHAALAFHAAGLAASQLPSSS